LTLIAGLETGDKKMAFVYSSFSGVAEPVGALIGFFRKSNTTKIKPQQILWQ